MLEAAGKHFALRSFNPDQAIVSMGPEPNIHEDISGPWWKRLLRQDPED